MAGRVIGRVIGQVLTVGMVVVCLGWLSESADAQTRPADRNSNQGEEFLTDVPERVGEVVLGRPTDRSVAVSVLLAKGGRVRVVYGREGAAMSGRSEELELKPGEPGVITLGGLSENAAYVYQVQRAGDGKAVLPTEGPGRFHTRRAVGEGFTFTVQADSHLDGGIRPDVYLKCLANQRADGPDFVVDLGDTFMTGKHPSRASAAMQYAAQRFYFSRVGAPVFLVLGNHDGEEAKKRGATAADGLSVWSARMRNGWFANPLPDEFYGGNSKAWPGVGELGNYYAWRWGDALFVVLDPYWTSTASRGEGGGWNMSLGKAQYDWLAATLRGAEGTANAGDRVKYKFVFIHQLVGGVDDAGRGGAEAAGLFEWGGRERDGRETFAGRRAGWEKPIHSLLVETGVDVVFHGHDHFWAREEVDGVVYQLVPQPGHRNYRSHHAEEYGYKWGEFLPSSGHVRVRVGGDETRVEYVRAATPDIENRAGRNGEVVTGYTVRAGPTVAPAAR